MNQSLFFALALVLLAGIVSANYGYGYGGYGGGYGRGYYGGGGYGGYGGYGKCFFRFSIMFKTKVF